MFVGRGYGGCDAPVRLRVRLPFGVVYCMHISNHVMAMDMQDQRESLLYNRRIAGTVTLVLLLLAVFLFAQSLNTFKAYQYVGADIPPMNTINVQGEGEAFQVPDVAEFTFSIVKEGETPNEVRGAADESYNAALNFVKEQGIEDPDLKTTSYNLSPRYTYRQQACVPGRPCPPGERELAGFELRQSVRVKVRDTAKAGDIIAGLAEMDVEEVSGLSFTIDDDDAVRAQARADAIADAQDNAEQLAEQLDVTLGRIVNFNEFGGGEPRPFALEMADEGRGGAATPAPARLEPGENRVVSNVNITYEIR